MKFEQWLEEQESLEEGWGKNLALAGMLGASAFGAGKYFGGTPQADPSNAAAVTQDVGNNMPNANFNGPGGVQRFLKYAKWKGDQVKKHALRAQTQGRPNVLDQNKNIESDSETSSDIGDFIK